jgi:hypothetical protein
MSTLVLASTPLMAGDVGRRRQVFDDGVEQRLDALVLEGRTTEHREELDRDRALADQRADLVVRGHLAVEIVLHGGLVHVDGRLDHLLAVFLSLRLHVVRNFQDVPGGAEFFIVPDQSLHLDEVDNASEFSLGADRQLHDDSLRAEAALDHLGRAVEVGTDLVHLVAEDETRNIVLVGLAPNRLGLRLDTGIRIEQRNGAVENAQRTLDFDGEVDVAGGVDDVEAAQLAVATLPEGRRRGRRDRDAALLLLLHPVHRCGAVMDFADLVRLARVVEHALSRRRLAGIDVSHDAEVTVVFDLIFASHDRCLSVSLRRLPAVVREGAVGFGHLVGVFTLLDGGATVVSGIHQFARQAVDHGRLVAVAGGGDQPADGKRLAALGADVDGNLVGRATDATAADFHMRRDIVERLMEDGDRLLLGLGLDLVEGTVDDGLGDRLLAVIHDGVHELGDDQIAELRVRVDLTLFCTVTTGHCFSASKLRGGLCPGS